VEIAWTPVAGWSEQCRELRLRYPGVNLGAASVCSVEALEATAAAGLGYAVSPILEVDLIRRASALGLTLVPGVFSPSEVQRARNLGCELVKLFPAATLGPGYWRRLAGPLGALPFCIAAGGLDRADVLPWLEAGVNAVALGARLLPGQDPALEEVISRITRPAPSPE
jgi:2-dehydro-3-deoxyphosphogluconate aldolase/(4S)-4-hydroxy-2-oxoglutarate aldolase